MNALQVKTHLWKNGLTISRMAREIQPEYGGTFHTVRSYLTELFYHEKYDQKLADLVESKFGIKIAKPSRPQTVSEAVRRTA